MRLPVLEPGQPDQPEHGGYPAVDVRARKPTDSERECHVGEDRHVGEQGVALEPQSTFRCAAGIRVTSRPPMQIRPALGSMSPAIRFSSVVLPEPLGPRIVTNWPWPTTRSMSWTARTAP